MAAAVAEDQALIEGKLVALGVAAEIVMVVEDQNPGAGAGVLSEEPGRGQPAYSAADHDKVIAFFDRHIIDRKMVALAADRVCDLERARMLTTQSRQGGRIAERISRELRGRSEPRGDRQRDAVEKVATRDRGHAGHP